MYICMPHKLNTRNEEGNIQRKELENGQRAKSLSKKQNVQLSELSVNEVFEARLVLESLDEEPNETSNEASELPQKNTEPSRIKRIKHLFAETVALVHTNKEDLENSEGLVQSKPASESEPNKETQGD